MQAERKIQLQFFIEGFVFFMVSSMLPFYVFTILLLFWYGANGKKEFLQVLRKICIMLIPKTKMEEQGEESQEKGESKHGSVIFHDELKKISDFQESVGFLNKIISKVWEKCLSPNISTDRVQEFLTNYAEVQRQNNSKWSGFLDKLEIEELRLGCCPLVVTRITTRDNEEKLSIRLDVVYPGDGRLALKLKHPDLIEGDIKNFGFAFKLEITLGPFHRDFTILRGISFSLIDHPILALEGGGIFNIPVETIMTVIKMTSTPILNYFIIKPRCISIEFAHDGYHYPMMSTPAGVLRVFVVEARNLIKTDTIFNVTGFKKLDDQMSSSDPYCVLRLGRYWVKSNQINRTLNPKFNFLAKFPIKPADFDDELIIELWDGNEMTDHISIGVTSINFSFFQDNVGKINDQLLDVASSAASGHIRVMSQYVPCCDPEECHDSTSAVLVIFIKSIRNNQRIEPIIAAQVSGHKKMTTVKGTFGQSHEFLEEIALVVEDVENDLLRISLYDAADRRISIPTMIKKGILRTKKFYQKDLIKHKKHDIDEQGFLLLGDITLPVKHFLDHEVTRLTLNPETEIESTIEVEFKLRVVQHTHTSLDEIAENRGQESFSKTPFLSSS